MRFGRATVGGSSGRDGSGRGGPRPGRRAAWIFAGLFLLSLASSRPAFARVPSTGGGLLLRTTEDAAEAAPLLEIDVLLRVTGPILRGTVMQRFRNPTERWLEGVYVFPLHQGAAVDGLRMRIGDRIVEGEIREREQARHSFERAREEGRRATLLEQQRADVFTARVANVGPGAEIRVEIDFQQTLRLDEGAFSLRLPWIVAPRFTPEGGERRPEEDAHGPVASVPGAGPDVALAIELDPGFPLAGIESASHPIRIEQLDLHRLLVTLRDETAPADRDFVLRWRPVPGSEPRAALFSEQRDDGTYLLLFLMPPDAAAPVRPPAREIVFVIDTSGSMGGPSMEQARAALKLALARLGPRDRFNVIAFASETRSLFATPVVADAAVRERAAAWVDRLEADGGTHMLPALVEALRDDAGGAGLRQVVFVTDGCVSNERELFAHVRGHLGRSRLFTVGIGSAPNGHFMEGAARFGRGTHTFIASPAEVGARMEALFAKLEHPALTDVEVLWNDEVETWPERVPDLYRAEPVLLSARLSRFVGGIRVRGRFGAAPWEARLPLVPGRETLGIGKLFGRRKIAALMDGLVTGEDPERVRHAVVEVALAHGLVSRFTSLVAVERLPMRPSHEDLLEGRVDAGLPAGFMLPAGATTAPLRLAAALASAVLGLALLLTARRRGA